MKKLFSLFFILLIFGACVKLAAQRIQLNKQSGSFLTYGWVNQVDVPGEDTVYMKPNAFSTTYSVQLTSNQNWKAPQKYNAQIGDEVKIYFKGNVGNIFRLIPSTDWNISTLQTFTITANYGSGGNLVFYYNGLIWLLIDQVFY